eukprot:TRINITY_DN4014_c0_g3_i1.p1 TRINITY_DN4014_c0_g3~~TRINITY_DN4014_c0_g3_i1.p1  ORF type:complete len:873 (+),score=171.25 TRINITY_DN4014_c0_g3_i1:178-2796(+)
MGCGASTKSAAEVTALTQETVSNDVFKNGNRSPPKSPLFAPAETEAEVWLTPISVAGLRAVAANDDGPCHSAVCSVVDVSPEDAQGFVESISVGSVAQKTDVCNLEELSEVDVGNDGQDDYEARMEGEPVVEEKKPKKKVLEPNWDELIDQGEVRPALSWHEAAFADEVLTLAWFLSSRSKIDELLNLQDKEHLTALHIAAREGSANSCEWLLQRYADPSVQERSGSAPLHFACLGGHASVVKMLLDPSALWMSNPPEINQESLTPPSRWPDVAAVDMWKRTPLHKAAEGGNAEVLTLILDAKAASDSEDKDGNTPLHVAVVAGQVKALRLLIKKRPRCAAPPIDNTNAKGFSPLDLCVLHKRGEMGDMLVRAGARLVKDREKPVSLIVAVRSDLPFLCDYILKCGPTVGPTSARRQLADLDENGRSPTKLASHAGHVEVLRRLLDGRADIESIGSAAAPTSPLSCSWNDGVSVAVKTSAALPIAALLATGVGLRPVHEAAAAGHLQAMQLLVERQATAESRDAYGQTALFHAAACGHVAVCEWLLGLTGAIAALAEDNREWTPLHAAAHEGQGATCEVILRFGGATPKLLAAEDWEGFTPAHLAVQAGHVDVCLFLASRRATLYAARDFGMTTVHTAAERGHDKVLKLLLAELATGSSGESHSQRDLGERTNRVDASTIGGDGGGDRGATDIVARGETSALFVLSDGLCACRMSDGRNAWLLAAGAGQLACCRRIWKAATEAVPEIGSTVDRFGRDALLLAACGGHVDVCAWLMEVKANPSGLDAVDACRWTALHVAAAENRRQAVDWLLRASANPLACDLDERTPAVWAELRGHHGVEAILREAEKDAEKAASWTVEADAEFVMQYLSDL